MCLRKNQKMQIGPQITNGRAAAKAVLDAMAAKEAAK